MALLDDSAGKAKADELNSTLGIRMVVGENQTSATCLIFTLVQWSPYSPTSPTPTHKQVNKQTNKCGLKKKGVLCPALAY